MMGPLVELLADADPSDRIELLSFRAFLRLRSAIRRGDCNDADRTAFRAIVENRASARVILRAKP
jgi:hypothetical protein